ncbi:MAG: V-type ATPase subunit [Thermoplasmata archaeon]
MLEGVIDSLGITNFVLIIVGLSLLIVVLLVMSYFKVLLSIANFTYPNAKYRAIGNPFLSNNVLLPLIEGNNLNEVYQKLENSGYKISKEATLDQNELESELESETMSFMRRAYRSCPLSAKEFAGAWLLRFDARMVKRALKSKLAGDSREDMKDKLIPVRRVDEKVIDSMVNARDLQEIIDVLKEAGFEEPLQGESPAEDMYSLEVSLDKYVYRGIQKSVKNVESEERPPVKYFFGKYVDVKNLKIVIRGLREGVDKEQLKKALLPSGRELERWKLESMVESSGLEEALVELEGTSYAEIRRDASTMGPFEIEKYLDKKMIQMASEVMSQNVLSVGPLLRYLVGKEVELRNLNILTRGIKEDIPKDILIELMILEDTI